MVLSQFYAYLVFIGSFIEPPEGLNYFFSWQNLLGSRVPRVPLGRTVNGKPVFTVHVHVHLVSPSHFTLSETNINKPQPLDPMFHNTYT